ncbi:MAG: DnaA regulatory inactivator Hda [Halioglobus sp.]|nr:DnaA regulatory inactivator Hda [Halioglobus sp.]
MAALNSDPPRRQLPLEIRLSDAATFDNFLARDGLEPVLNALRAQLGPAGEPGIYLCGPAGAGKSHLLQACCHSAGADALYLPLAQLREYAPREVLRDLARLRLVCLDDLHAVAGDDAWETALFNLWNEARERGCRLAVSAHSAPRALPLHLADLRSRLSWGVVFQLNRLDDLEKMEVLRFRAQRRGLKLSPEVARYIVHRAPRDPAKLLGLLDQLDTASMVEKRSLSIPFVRRALGW